MATFLGEKNLEKEKRVMIHFYSKNCKFVGVRKKRKAICYVWFIHWKENGFMLERLKIKKRIFPKNFRINLIK